MPGRKSARRRKLGGAGKKAKPGARRRAGSARGTRGGRKDKAPSRAPRKRKAAVRKAAGRKRAAKRKGPASPRTGARPSAQAYPSRIGFVVQHMDYTSHATEDVRRFYTETLGFASHSEQGGYLLVRTGPGSSLGFMGPSPVPPEQWRPPREPAIFFMVANVDEAYANLTARGVEFDRAPENTRWGLRVAALRDPEGRTVCLAQAIER